MSKEPKRKVGNRLKAQTGNILIARALRLAKRVLCLAKLALQRWSFGSLGAVVLKKWALRLVAL